MRMTPDVGRSSSFPSEGTASFWKRRRRSKRCDPKSGAGDVGGGLGVGLSGTGAGGPGLAWESVTFWEPTGPCVGVSPDS